MSPGKYRARHRASSRAEVWVRSYALGKNVVRGDGLLWIFPFYAYHGPP